MCPPSHRWLLCLCLLLGLATTAPARADIDLAAKRLDAPGVRLQDVTLHIAEDGNGGLSVRLHARHADVPAMGWRRVGLDLSGGLQRDVQLRWLLDGALQLHGAPGGAASDARLRLTVDESANTLQADIDQAKAHASVAMPLDQPSHLQINLANLPANWLQGLLGTMWSGHTTGGRLDASMALDVHAAGVQSSGEFSLDRVGFDTPSGTLAGQGVSGKGRLGVDTGGDAARITLDAALGGGQLVLGPLYAKLPDHPVQLALTAATRKGTIAVNHLTVSDPDALQLAGALAFDAKGELDKLRLDRFQAQFPAAYQRYGQAWLATLGLNNVKMRGALSGSVDLRADGPHAFAFDTSGLDLADADGRLVFDGLRGGIDWALQGERPATSLSWQRLQFYKLPSGAAQSRWQSHAGMLSLQGALALPLLQGTLRVGDLDWRPAAAKGQRLATSLTVVGVDLAALGKAMGWPQFPGTLAGAIPALRWVDDRLVFDGGLSLNVFNGFVDITQLALQHPLGPGPALTADVHLRQLDLGAITSVFDFGSITGRLQGAIEDLHLVDWSPVAFKARLLADDGGRISQRAVNNLTSVGGGGIVAGLQGAMLRLFKTFGYQRIGLNCTLEAGVCHMSGLEPSADGYTIVEGSGLPHLQVIGHQRAVDWATLLRRLKAATEGAAPQVR